MVDSKRTNERGPFLVGFLGLSYWYKRFLFCLGCSSRPNTKFFPHRTLFQFLCPYIPATWAGSRAGSPVSSCVSLFKKLLMLTCENVSDGAGVF